jgi:DNA-binding GntR family transcriptional regulator
MRPDGSSKDRVSKAEQVYREIRSQILTGALTPGMAIDKFALCEKLGVSRFPVSAAIHRLAFERLVSVEPQHGSFVALMSAHTLREFMMIRRALESEIAGMSASALSGADKDELARNLRYQKAAAQAEDVAGFYALDVAFHQIIARPLGLEHTVDVLDAARTHLERARRLLLSPQGRLPKTYAEHETLSAALLDGDVVAAREAMRAHLERAQDNLEVIFKERPELFDA